MKISIESHIDILHLTARTHSLPRVSVGGKANAIPMVIYLHGNCGCRLDATEILREVLLTGIYCNKEK